jgi:hypothetical protein
MSKLVWLRFCQKNMRPHDSIIGVWSTASCFDSDGPGEDILTFREDGTGRYDFENYGNYDSTTFRWSFPRPDHLTVVGVQFFRFAWSGRLRDLSATNQRFEEAPYYVEMETTRLGRTIPVLHADLWYPLDARFGLYTRDIVASELEKHLTAIGAPR